MGYDFTLGATKKDIIARRTRNWITDGADYACLKRALRGNTLWSVWEKTPQEGPTERFIRCDLLRKDKGYGWGYKAMYESMHPYQYSCPLGYLDLVPVANQEWRDKVKRFHHKFQVGETVELQGSTIPHVIITNVKPLQGTYQGHLYRIPRGMIA